MTRSLSILLIPALLLVAACTPKIKPGQQQVPTLRPNTSQLPSVIAMGSCNDEEKKQPLWHDILDQTPDLWLWLGDNVYADTDDQASFRKQYDKQLANPDYTLFRKKIPMLGIWDDHDYGLNDGGKEYTAKEISKKEMLRFLGVPANDPVWSHEGAYTATRFEDNGKSLNIILLDARWFRDPITRVNKVCQPDPDGDILGEEQWTWLEKELNTPADIAIIGSGIQFIPQEHPYEKWANFPTASKRLFDLIDRSPVKQIVLVSGDRHLAEVSKTMTPGGRTVWELTTSGLTHSYNGEPKEINTHRVGPVIARLNYGILRIDWDSNSRISAEIRGVDNILYHQIEFKP